MGAPNVNWNYFAYHRLGFPVKESISAPVGSDANVLRSELSKSGDLHDINFVKKSWEKFAWPGGYPIYYVTQDMGCLCGACANHNIELTTDPEAAPDWKIVAAEVNYENHDLYCDNCNAAIEAAYGDDDVS